MIFYFEATTTDFEGGEVQEKGLVIARNFGEAAKQVEEPMFDCLLSIDKLEAIDGTDILYLTNNPLRKPLIKSIKEKAVW